MKPVLHRIPKGVIRDPERPEKAHRCCVFCTHIEARDIEISAFNGKEAWRFTLNCLKHDFETGDAEKEWCDDFDWR